MLAIAYKSKQSSLTSNSIPIVPLIENGLEALTMQEVKPMLVASAKDYLSGKTTQMPMPTFLNIGSSQIGRSISIGSKSIRYEA
jgi:hypothetical protein